MKHLKFNKMAWAPLLSLLALTSCEKEEYLAAPDLDSELQKQASISPFAISVDEALADLRDFMDGESIDGSRAGDDRTVKNVYSISTGNCLGIQSRSELDSLNCDNLVYIANFENNRGYAVLAADSRIPKRILGIVDTVPPDFGRPRPDPQPAFITDWDDLGLPRPVYDGYPTDGPGFFTVPEYPGEIFLNPNTVNLYDEEADDTLVGTYFFDEDETSRAGSKEPSFDAENFALNLCTSYAANEIICYGLKNPNLQPNDTVDFHIPGLDYDVTYKIIDTSPWKTINVTRQYLSKYRYWYQTGEYNDQYPYRRRYLFFGHKRKAPTGCFPLALAKIMAHFKKPANLVLNNSNIDLYYVHDGITNIPEYFKVLQTLLYGISKDCNSLYFYQGTFTFPCEITSLMKKIGYPNVVDKSYSFSRVTQMIDKGCPMIMYGMPSINITKSHAWNIDGYKIKARTVTKARYEGSTRTNTFTVNDTCKMVHCDFGWGGGANGFYESDVFNSTNEKTELDDTSIKPNSFKFNNLLRLITYDHP